MHAIPMSHPTIIPAAFWRGVPNSPGDAARIYRLHAAAAPTPRSAAPSELDDCPLAA